MTDITTTETHNLMEKKDSRNPDINFLGNGKFQNPKFLGKFPVPTSQEETLIVRSWM